MSNLLTVENVASRLNLSTRQIWKLTASEKMPSPVRVSRSVRWRERDISSWIELGCPSRAEFESARGRAAKKLRV